MRNLILLIFSLVLISSCKKDDDVILFGYHFFPIEEGKYVSYNVVDIFHDIALLPAHDTDYYQVKEVIGEEEIDGEGQPYRKLYRYQRLNDTLDWSMKDVWTVKRTAQIAETLEENKRRISMAFSISYDQVWNYNALNEDAPANARYDYIYEPLSLGGLSYDSTVRVEIMNQITFIDFIRQYDVYAANVGKILSVRKNLEILNYDTTQIKKGSEVFYTAFEYGIE